MQEYPPQGPGSQPPLEQGGPVPPGAWNPQGPGSIPGVMPAAVPHTAQTGRKRRRGCLIALLVLVLLICGCVGAGIFMLSRAGAQRDLGVTATQADFDSACAKLGLEFPKDPPNGDWENYERVYTGSKPMDAVLTQSEVSALMSYNHGSGYWPVKNVQVKFLGGDKAEMSCVVTYQGVDYPVYAAGSGSVSGKILQANIAEAEVAGIKVPSQYLPQGSELLSKMVTNRLERIEGLNVESVEVQGDQVRVTGTVWESAEWVPK